MLVGGRGNVPVFTYVVAFPAQLMATTAMEKAVSLGKPANLMDVRLVDELPVPIRMMVYWAGLPPLGVHMTVRSNSPGVTETEGCPGGAGVVWMCAYVGGGVCMCVCEK